MTEKSNNLHRVAEAPMPGKQYQCMLNGMPLYEARIKDVMGCWATVEVVHPIPGPHESNYKSGQTFDIRVSSYTFQEKA
jgi:hypothetical protein